MVAKVKTHPTLNVPQCRVFLNISTVFPGPVSSPGVCGSVSRWRFSTVAVQLDLLNRVAVALEPEALHSGVCY